MECSPKEIDKEVIEFCKMINYKAKPQFVTVRPRENCCESYCYDNVNHVVDKKGGKSLGGWVIWKRDNMYLEAEAHAVWETDSGDLIDVTPHTPIEKNIVFLRDERVCYNGKRISSDFFPLTNSAKVRDYISCCKRIQHLEDKNRDINGNVRLSNKDKDEYIRRKHLQSEMDYIFETEVGRNEPCPCGSGMKYKKCCGKHR